MSKIIATVKLAPGRAAFYDEYTKIHLTLSNPTAHVCEGMNLKRIKNAVKCGALRVLYGSLSCPETPSAVVEDTPVVHKNVEPETVVDKKTFVEPEITVSNVLPEEPIINTAECINGDQTVSISNDETFVDTTDSPIDNENGAVSTVEATTEVAEKTSKRGKKKADNTQTEE